MTTTGDIEARRNHTKRATRTSCAAATLAMSITLALLCQKAPAAIGAAAYAEVSLTDGWQVTQDVRDLGEKTGWYQPDFKADWQPIDRLAHLQLLFAKQPYFGRELRYFNEHAWWYRLEFKATAFARGVTLRFEGVDYFSKVWLNGTLLGAHEGYADPFDFEVGNILHRDSPNVLVVKVWSPWDHVYTDLSDPVWSVERNLLKGSYEHADTFVQRDVNPVGIWRPIRLISHDELRERVGPTVSSLLSEDKSAASIQAVWSIDNDGPPQDFSYVMHVRSKQTGTEVATSRQRMKLAHGINKLESSVRIASPKLWTTWDRGGQPLYEAVLELVQLHKTKLGASVTFGIRSVQLHRSDGETRFFINGEPIYLRGATYWPDVYLSNVTRARYERDLKAAIKAGFNAVRVHVHTENPEFYQLCDQMGIAVIQDNDLTWVFPTTPEFTTRAVQHFGTIVDQLKSHASIVGWIAINEVGMKGGDENGLMRIDSKAFAEIGSRLVAEARKRDPSRPVIENSIDRNSIASGDIHDYRGSLAGGKWTYFDIFGGKDKFVTEFGVDAPAAYSSLRAVPEAADRLRAVLPRIAELHDYQYHLLKYYIEHYRIQKYAPNAGYFQFMWIDFSPQSFYGVYDYWGVGKTEGLGGGLRALQESNQPIGIFMEHNTKPVALHAVNDTSSDLGPCVAHWRVSDSTGVIAEGSQKLQIRPDSHQKIRDFTFAAKDGETYEVVLDLLASDGTSLAHNTYVNPFTPQPRPEGFPERRDDELGMRLWWAGEKK